VLREIRLIERSGVRKGEEIVIKRKAKREREKDKNKSIYIIISV